MDILNYRSFKGTFEFDLKRGVCFVENGSLNSKMEVCFRKRDSVLENGSLFSNMGFANREFENRSLF